uniref:Interleukin-4 n=1 Tax=Salmo trutta TaxID=8032 RepID=A0A674DGQ6_SALTR
MENIFRSAFLMLFLSVGLQGHPANNLERIKIGIQHLQNNIKCSPRANSYVSFSRLQKSIAGALACSIQQLNHLDNANLQHHINKTLKVLQATFVDDIRTDSSECSREKPLFKKSCKEFLENMISLGQALSVKSSK